MEKKKNCAEGMNRANEKKQSCGNIALNECDVKKNEVEKSGASWYNDDGGVCFKSWSLCVDGNNKWMNEWVRKSDKNLMQWFSLFGTEL